MDLLNINSLLNNTSLIITQNEHIKKLKGESFNLFSIMQMETAENKTHSNFIAELLKPYGTHLNGSIYLNCFLDLFCKNHLDIASTKVKVEHNIGKIDLERSTGGRIDIYLWDKNGRTVCIENKIDAKDQPKQIKRYYNHNTQKNKVFYLTKYGIEPKKYSKLELKSSEHFTKISYQKDILTWLELCLKESSDQPILRESIKQYLVLIKKLTNTMDKQFDLELKRVMISNLEATRFVRDNAKKYLDEIKDDFRIAIINALKEKLDHTKFSITKGNKVEERYAQIWISFLEQQGLPLMFGIETFSGSLSAHLGGNLFIGIINHQPENYSFQLNEMNSMSDLWLHFEEIKLNDEFISLWNQEFLIQIVDKASIQFKHIVEVVTNQCVDFINSNSIWVQNENLKTLSILKNQK